MRLVVSLVLLTAASLAACAPAQQQHARPQTATDAVTLLQADLTHSFPAEHPDLSTLRTELAHSLPADGVSILSAEMAYTLPQNGASKARVVAPADEPATPAEPKVLQTWGYSEPEADDASQDAESDSPEEQLSEGAY